MLELARRRRAKLYYLRDRPLKVGCLTPHSLLYIILLCACQESFVSARYEGPRRNPEAPIPVIKANRNRKKPVRFGAKVRSKRDIKRFMKIELKSATKPVPLGMSRRHLREVRTGMREAPAAKDREQILLSNSDIRSVLKRKVKRAHKAYKRSQTGEQKSVK